MRASGNCTRSRGRFIEARVISHEGPKAQCSSTAAGRSSSGPATGGSRDRGDAVDGILIRAVTSLTSSGLRGPRSDGTLTQDNMRQLLKKYREYREKVERAGEDGVPPRPCGVIELRFLPRICPPFEP